MNWAYYMMKNTLMELHTSGISNLLDDRLPVFAQGFIQDALKAYGNILNTNLGEALNSSDTEEVINFFRVPVLKRFIDNGVELVNEVSLSANYQRGSDSGFRQGLDDILFAPGQDTIHTHLHLEDQDPLTVSNSAMSHHLCDVRYCAGKKTSIMDLSVNFDIDIIPVSYCLFNGNDDDRGTAFINSITRISKSEYYQVLETIVLSQARNLLQQNCGCQYNFTTMSTYARDLLGCAIQFLKKENIGWYLDDATKGVKVSIKNSILGSVSNFYEAYATSGITPRVMDSLRKNINLTGYSVGELNYNDRIDKSTLNPVDCMYFGLAGRTNILSAIISYVTNARYNDGGSFLYASSKASRTNYSISETICRCVTYLALEESISIGCTKDVEGFYNMIGMGNMGFENTQDHITRFSTDEDYEKFRTSFKIDVTNTLVAAFSIKHIEDAINGASVPFSDKEGKYIRTLLEESGDRLHRVTGNIHMYNEDIEQHRLVDEGGQPRSDCYPVGERISETVITSRDKFYKGFALSKVFVVPSARGLLQEVNTLIQEKVYSSLGRVTTFGEVTTSTEEFVTNISNKGGVPLLDSMVESIDHIGEFCKGFNESLEFVKDDFENGVECMLNIARIRKTKEFITSEETLKLMDESIDKGLKAMMETEEF